MTSTIFCIDFDETLLNTDRLRADIEQGIGHLGGEQLVAAYQKAYEAVREKYGGVSIPHVLREVAGHSGTGPEVHHQLAELFHSFPYEQYVYPGAVETITQLKTQGRVIIFSDGDAFFHPQKIYATSLARLVDAVVILPKKVDCFSELTGYYPAEMYIFIDDKQKVLDAAKEYFGEKSTTVLVRQGRYATEAQSSTADMSVAAIGEVAALFPGS